MKKIVFLIIFSTALLNVFIPGLYAGNADKYKYDAVYGQGDHAIAVATATPGSLGLLGALATPFCQTHPCRINWIKKGSGASLKLLKTGQVDMVMVHAPAAEKKAVREGWAVQRTLIGANEFFIVGPHSDPAGIRNAKSAQDAYAMIAASQAKFFSRGDNSGTHKKEMKIWEIAKIRPQGSWYKITQDFMGPTLMRADKERGYFMTDSSTFFAKQSKLKNLVILFQGDPFLVNVYHALCRPEKAPEGRRYASWFIAFVASDIGQKIVGNFGKNEYGEPIYKDAAYAAQFDH